MALLIVGSCSCMWVRGNMGLKRDPILLCKAGKMTALVLLTMVQKMNNKLRKH